MCALAALLPCPLCDHPNFDNAETLRNKLIFVSTHRLICPVCQEQVTGLDKLTIHLFGHVQMRDDSLSAKTSEFKRDEGDHKRCSEKPPVYNRPRTQPSKNKTTASTKAPVKFVRIYPKLPVLSLNTMPFLEVSRNSSAESLNRSLCLSTVTDANNQTVSRKEHSVSNVQYCCDICGIPFGDERILKMHKILIHNVTDEASLNMENFQCHLCNKHFKMKGSLMVHLRVVHYGIPSFSATATHATSSENSPSSQGGAQATATPPANGRMLTSDKQDNKQWFCDVCEKSFTTKYFLKKHKRLHTGETPYACVECNKTFTFQQSYHKHLLYHNDEKPHGCTHCGRTFKELSTLHNHQRIHTGEKPFSCETCGKCFRQRVSYLVHRRIHTGVMPFKCTACDKSFRYKVSQRTHKCPAQPPGKVVRQSGELLEKLMKKHTTCDTNVQNITQRTPLDSCTGMSEANVELIRSGAKLSFEDTEADNFSLISKSPSNADEENALQGGNVEAVGSCTAVNGAIASDRDAATSTDRGGTATVHVDSSVPSPSEIFKNLCLANYEDEYTAHGDASKNIALRHDDLHLDVIYKEFKDFL